MIIQRQYVLPILASVVCHAGLVAFLASGWDSTPEPRKISRPQFIEAKLVELKPKTAKPSSVEKKPNIVDLTAKKRELEKQKQLAEQKRKSDAQRREAEAKKVADAKKRKEQEIKDKQLREQAEKQKAQREAEEQKRRQLEREFEQALQEEEGMLLEEQYATTAQSYAALIQQRVVNNWSRPPSARNGMRCELTISMVPNGRVVDVVLARSSGNPAFDRSAIAAVKKVETFPEVKDIPIEVFERHFRKFSLGFQPEDLRQ